MFMLCDVLPKGPFKYSHRTITRTKTRKHDSSSAYIYTYDVLEIFNTKITKRKLVSIMGTDESADKATCFPKILSTAVDLFKMFKVAPTDMRYFARNKFFSSFVHKENFGLVRHVVL